MDHKKATRKRKHRAQDPQQQDTQEPSSSSPSTSSSWQEPINESGTSTSTSRMTVWRSKTREKHDQLILSRAEELTYWLPGSPCPTCLFPRHASTGHVFYRGHFYCMAEDPLGQDKVEDWIVLKVTQLQGKRRPRMPRTTLWRRKKTREPKRPKAVYKCQRCGLPSRKDYGHTNLKGTKHCTMAEGVDSSLWLARAREKAKGSKTGHRKDKNNEW